MPSTISAAERRREPRYPILSDQPVAAHVQRQPTDEQVVGKLTEISRYGAKLSLRCCLRFAEAIEIRIVVPALGLNALVAGEVSWIRPEGDGWLVGCSLTSPVPDEALQQLAKARYIDRRRHPRYAVKSSARARWELDNQTSPVEIRDYSKGGFCLAATRPSRVGASVLLEFDVTADDSPRRVFGKVCWQAKRDDEYLLGCAITNHEDGVELFTDLVVNT